MHPAIAANLNSIKFAMAKDKESWLALYRDDAIICDPVGKSMLDPVGEGHKGKAAIADFFDNVIASANVKLVPGEHRIGGERSCAVPMQARNDLGEGVITTVDMITVYHVDEEGLIASMHAYWDWSALEQELMTLMG
jgi:hypothetical protein